MALDRATAGDVIDLAGLGDGLAGTPTHAVYEASSVSKAKSSSNCRIA